MRNLLIALLALVLPLAALSASAPLGASQDQKQARDLPAFLGPLPKPPDPKDNPSTPAKVELGRMLYYEPRISGNGTISCSTCHNPGLGWADGLAKGIGINGSKLGRSSPTVANAAYYELQFWDGGRPPSRRRPRVRSRIRRDGRQRRPRRRNADGDPRLPEGVPGGLRLARDQLRQVRAGGGRVRADVVDLDSPFDRYARGNDKAMDVSATRGLELFVGKANCAVCHSGPNLADKRFHNIGIDDGDDGRFAVTKNEAERGAFRTPTLRNIALTGPYMHNGSQKTLREVIDHYEKVANEGKAKHPNLSIFFRPFKLNEDEKKDLEAFMRASHRGQERPAGQRDSGVAAVRRTGSSPACANVRDALRPALVRRRSPPATAQARASPGATSNCSVTWLISQRSSSSACSFLPMSSVADTARSSRRRTCAVRAYMRDVIVQT